MTVARLVRWRYASAVASASVDRRISHITIIGIITPTVAAQILRDNAAWLKRHHVLAQVADYRGAVWAISAESLLASALQAAPDGLDVPTSLVFAPHYQDLCEAYCGLMSQNGICRAPALSLEQGLRWARRMAPVWRELTSESAPSQMPKGAAAAGHVGRHQTHERFRAQPLSGAD